MKRKFELKEKTALITGASSGIGAEFAKQLAGRGVNLILAARSSEGLQKIAREIRIEEDLNVEIISLDLEDPESPKKIFEKLKNENIPVDILINNAGFGHWGRFEETPFDKNFRMDMLNISSLVSLCHLFIQPMLERKEGGIINVASTAAFQPLPYMANYAATKAFVLNFSLALWQEYRDRGVIVSALCPGYTKTGFQKIAGMPEKFSSSVAEPSVVVKSALEGFLKSEPVIIPKVHRDFVQFTLSKFVPLKIKLSMIADMFKPE